MNNGIQSLWPTAKTARKIPIGGRRWAFHDERVEKSKESGFLDILEVSRQLREEHLSHDHHCVLGKQRVNK